MKKYIQTILLFFFLFCVQSLVSQTVQQIAFVNSAQLLDLMPERVRATQLLTDLNAGYKSELKVMENDYKKKYSDFISYQNTMADNIRLRRMQELYELERHVNDFMKVAQEDVQDQESKLLEPLRQKVSDAIYQVGVENGYIVIYDLANPAIAFVTPDAADITALVKRKLGIKN